VVVFWSPKQTCAVNLVGYDAVIDKLVYTACPPWTTWSSGSIAGQVLMTSPHGWPVRRSVRCAPTEPRQVT